MKKGSFASIEKNSGRAGLRVAVALALLTFSGVAFADPPVTMAPPVDSGYSQSTDGQSYSNDGAVASQDSVFQWQEVPSDQRVPIRRAVFDRGGYQLFDSQGETIIIPFSDNNLYVMKFARSTDGTTYFVNGGDAPILYVPQNGYLENAAVPGARWFPFSQDFHPAEPVFLGVAPSWDDYVSMGWYPDMVCYGGYWNYNPYVVGSVFFPSFGLTFVIGGHSYHGWEPYHRYYNYHPAPYHTRYFNRDIYRFDGRPNRGREVFRGTGRPYEVHRNGNNGRVFGGDHQFANNHGFDGRRNSDDHRDYGNGRDGNNGRIFRGTGNPTYAHRDYPGSRDTPGAQPMPGSGQNPGRDHSFGNGGTNNRPVFTGGFGHSSDGGNTRSMPSNGGDHNFSNGGDHSGSRGGDSNRTFRGGDSRPSFGGSGQSSPNQVHVNTNNNNASRANFNGGFGHMGGGVSPDRQRSFGGGGGSVSRPSSGGGDHSGGGNHSDGGGRSGGGGDHGGGGGGRH